MALLDKLFGPPDKDRFARMVLDAVRNAGEGRPVRYEPEHFRLTVDAEGVWQMNLANAYCEYCAAPRAKRQVIFRNLVRAWFSHRREAPTAFEDVRHDLLPGVRNRAYYEVARLTIGRQAGAKFDWPYRVLAGSLGAGLVYDLPESMMQIQQHSLDDWGATFDEAFAVALENLRQISGHAFDRAGPGVWASRWRDNYDPSRMLLPELLRRQRVEGDPVVMVPNRDTLLLAGSRDAAGLGRLAELAEAAYDQPRPISGLAFRLSEDDEWVPFRPAPAVPRAEKFRLLGVKSVGGDYAEQGEALKALHEETGKDIFVASFSARQEQSGEVRSYCVWSEGVVSFLPRTDDVFFFRPKGDEDGDIVAAAPWEKAEAVLGDMLKPVGLYPERYLVDGFPSEEQLAALGSE